MQKILRNYEELSEFLRGAKKIFFVHGKSAENFSRLTECLSSLGAELFHFTSFTPNPKIEEAEAAYASFIMQGSAVILAGGGGTAIDVSKFVKMRARDVPFVAIPTTAGSGSEATRFAVLYENGKKLSITDENILPDAILFDPELIKFLPEYHKKSSALDAFCHALESFWSVNATEQSKIFSRAALTNITRILENYPASYNAREMLESSYTAGKAINLAQTTAGHAMCYQITKIFGTAHGHSAAMCSRILFRWLVKNSRLPVLNDIARAMGCDFPEQAAEKFAIIFSRLGLEIPNANENDIEILSQSVNPERLKNFPAKLDTNTIKILYREIFSRK